MIPCSGPITYKSLIVGQAWSTCYEMYFYFLLAVLLIVGISKKWLLPLILLLFAIGFALIRICPSNGFLGYIFSLIGAQHVLFFCEGILIARYHESILRFQIKNQFLIGLTILASVLYIFILCHSYSYILSLVISPIFFVVVYKANEFLPNKGIMNTVMVRLGDISFSIYLIHLVVILFLKNQCGIKSFGLLLLCSLTATIIFSLLSYYLIEKKFIDLGKKISLRWAPK